MIETGKLYKYKFNAKFLPNSAILWPYTTEADIKNMKPIFSIPSASNIYENLLLLIYVENKQKPNNRGDVALYYKLRFLIKNKLYVTGWIYKEHVQTLFKKIS